MAEETAKIPSLKKQSSWLLFAKVVGFGFSFLLPLFVVRFLTQEQVGVYRQVFLVIANANTIFTLGFGMSAYYFLPRETARRPLVVFNTLLFNFAVGALVCLALVLYPQIIGNIFQSAEIERLAPKIGVIIWLWIVSTYLETVAVANREPKTATVFIICAQMTKTVLMLAAVMIFSTVESFVYAAMVQAFLQTLILLWYLNSRFPRFWTRFDWSFFREQLFYALPFGLAGLVVTVQTDVHNYFVGYRFSSAEFAVYAIGCFELPLIGMLAEAVGSVLIPRMSELEARGDRAEIIRLMLRATEKLAFFYLPVYVFLMITAQTFITTLFTREYAASVPIFLINLTLLPVYVWVTDPIIRAYKELGRLILILRVFILVALIAALYFGIQRFDLRGMIAIVVVAAIAEKTISTALVFKKLNVRRADLRALKAVGATALASLIAGVFTSLFYWQASGAIFNIGARLAQMFFAASKPNAVNFVAGGLVLASSALVFAPIYLLCADRFGTIEDAEKKKLLSIIGSRLSFVERLKRQSNPKSKIRMCGIAGFIAKEKDAPAREREILLDKMCSVITHRGPDEQGAAVAGRAALGMRRLAIIDLRCGQQPISDDTGNLTIVFNGEIYNYLELKRELESLGHRFKTNSDTETILLAYKQFGAACLEKLRGMFAFAIWDKRDESLFIARDRVGKKPLFYALTETGNFVFGSELKVLLTHGEVKKEIDFAALDAYLTFGYVPEEFCIFKKVQKLAPANYLIFKNGRVEKKQYWDFRYAAPVDVKTEDEYVERLRELLKEAVKIRLLSEVPLGAFLSGGVDSSTVVGLMSQVSDAPVKTFSIGFNEDSFNELKYARLAAKHFNTEHHEFIVTPDLVETIDDLIWHFDEPFADSSALPTFMVSKMARDFVTVVLSGDGGDELFAGYTRYVIDRQRSGLERLPRAFRKNLLRPLSENLPHGFKGKNYLYNASLDAVDRYIDSVSHFNAVKKSALYSANFAAQLNGGFGAGEKEFRRIAGKISTGNATDNLLYLDSKTYLPSDILTKVDRMSMAASLEARVPLLDHKLIEFVTNIPTALKLKNLETKYIFRRAVRGLVPDAILDRPKQGFGVPIGDWINAQLKDRMRETLSEKRFVERGYFNPKYVETLFDEHARGRRDHSYQLWILFALELWHRKFMDE